MVLPLLARQLIKSLNLTDCQEIEKFVCRFHTITDLLSRFGKPPSRRQATPEKARRGRPVRRLRFNSELFWLLTFPQNEERDTSTLRHFLGTGFVPHRRKHDAFMCADVVRLRVKFSILLTSTRLL